MGGSLLGELPQQDVQGQDRECVSEEMQKLSVCLSASLSVRPSVHPSVCLSVCLPACLSLCLTLSLSVCLSQVEGNGNPPHPEPSSATLRLTDVCTASSRTLKMK